MSQPVIDVLARNAAKAVSRRASLRVAGVTLGAGALSPVLAASSARAAKKKKKGNNKCRSQREPCLDVVRRNCERLSLPAEREGSRVEGDLVEACIRSQDFCCDFIEECELEKTLRCLSRSSMVR